MNVKKITNLLSFFFFFLFTNATFSQSWAWAVDDINSKPDNAAYGIAMDNSRNSYIVGNFTGTAKFGSTTLTSAGGTNIYLVKYSPTGAVDWAVSAGGPTNDNANGYAVAVDDSGNVLITGSFIGIAYFGADTLKAGASGNTNTHIFVAKYSSAGVLKWVVQAGSSSINYATSIAVDAGGNAYIAGTFEGSSKIGNNTFAGYGSVDVFAAKLNSSGVFIWSVAAGSINNDNAYGAALDSTGFYVTGSYTGTFYFTNSSTNKLYDRTSGIRQMYLLKYSLSAGSLLWAQESQTNFSGSSGIDGDIGEKVTVDQLTGDPIVVGGFMGTDSFSTTVSIKGNNVDAFIARYTTAGVFKWALGEGSYEETIAEGVTTDHFGDAIVTGFFSDTMTINGTNYISNGIGDDNLFLGKLTSSGSFVNFTTAGNAYAAGTDVAVDLSGNAYITGEFNKITLGSTTFIANNPGAVFTAKYQYNTCMSGTYTIGGTNPDFTTITKAINHLDSVGVCGPVTFNIANGTYKEQLIINSIPGASAVNTVTFQSAALDSADVTIEYTGGSPSSTYLVTLNGANFVTFRELTMRGSTNVYNMVYYEGNASDISLLNNRIYGVYNGGGEVISNNSENDTAIVIENNIIKYDDYGIFITGNSTVEASGIVIQGNLIDSNIDYNLDLYYDDAPKIIGNTLTNAEYGIVIYYCNNGIQMLQNKVSSIYYFLYDYYNDIGTGSTVSQTTPTLIANNFFAAPYGGFIYNSSYQDFYFNNINTPLSYAFEWYNYPGGVTYTGNTQENNNFVTSSATDYTLYENSNSNNFIITSDYNNFYNGGTSNLIYWNGTSYSTLAAYKSGSGKDAHSINVNPKYTSATNLDDANASLHNAGLPMPALVPEDIYGHFRSPNAVTIGAVELFPDSNDAGISAIYPTTPYAAGTQEVQARLENFGKNTLTSASVNWQINGANGTVYNWTGSLASGGTVIVNLGTDNFVLGNSYTIKIWSSKPNGKTDTDPINDTMVQTSCPGLAGTYTIGTNIGDNFTTFNDAVNALSCGGAAGPVIFDVQPGTYNEQVDIPLIKYASSVNTVTFDGGAGNAANCILTYAAAASTASHTLRLNNTHYIIIKNLTIQTTGSKYGSAVHIFGSSGSNVVENCVLQVAGSGATSSSQYFTPLLINNTTDISNPTSAINANNITIKNDTLIGGYYGIYAFVSNNQNNVFDSNVIASAYQDGAYLYGFDGLVFVRDSINMRSGNILSTGLYVSGGYTVAPEFDRINQNKIINAGEYGMNINSANSSEVSGEIINNMVGGGFSDSSAPYGISVSGNDWNIWYNTVNIDVYSYSSTAAAFNLASGDSNEDVRDNIFAVTGGGNALAAYINSTSSVTNFGYNDYFVKGLSSSGNLLYFGGNYTPSNYKGAGSTGNTYSVVINPDFVSATNLNLQAPCLAGLGTPITGSPDALYDIYGATRSVTAPTMGAQEFKPYAYNLGLAAITAPTGGVATGTSYNVIVKGFNYGSATITTLQVAYTINGGTPVVQRLTGLSIAPCDSITISFTSTSGPGGSSQQAKFTGGIATLVAYSDSINGVMDQYPANDTITESLCTPLSGLFTINSGAVASAVNFTSFSSAAAALSGCGVNGPVTLEVVDGTYTENVYIGNINGVSATNTVTFRSQRGIPSKVVLTSPATSSSAAPNYTLALDSSKYVTFTRMTIQRTGSGTYGNVIVLANGANNDTFSDNYITGIKTSGNNGQIVDIASVGGDTGNYYTRNVISYGSYGIAIVGSGKTYPKGNYIQYDVIDSPSYGGIAMDSVNYVLLQHDSITGITANNGFGIALVASIGNGSTIKKCKIYMPNGGNGIEMVDDSSRAIGAMYVQNNFISIAGSSTSYGLYSENDIYQDYYYNSVNITNSSVNSRGAYFDATSSNSANTINILDNCWVNSGGGLAEELTANAVTVGYVITSDYDNFYTGKTNLAAYDGSTYKTIAAYSSASGYETHSISVNPGYKSAVDLHASNAALAVGIAVSGVLEDIDDQIRPAVDPDIGADQFVSPADAGIDSLISPNVGSCAGTVDVIVRLKNFGNAQLQSANINWAINGTVQTSYAWTGALNSGATMAVTIGTMTLASGSSYTIITGTSSPNGGKDLNDANDSITTTVSTGLSGTYTIGATGSTYTTFGAAVAALKSKGICGPVTFNVKSGTYNEQVRITKIVGASATNTITFQSATLDSANVILTQAATSSSSTPNYTLELDSANYIIFKKITIQRTGSGTYATVIQLADSADNNQFLNNQIFSIKATAQTVNQTLLYATQPDTGNLIMNNYMLYGSYSIYLEGSAVLGYGKDNKIISNVIDSPYYTCVFLLYQNGDQVLKNTISSPTKNVSAYGYGISLDLSINQIEIMDNRIYLAFGGTGIFSNSTIGTSAAKPALIANNFITVAGAGTSYGINSLDDGSADYYFNSVLVTNTNSNSYAANFNSYGSTTINDEDNIFMNSGGGYAIGIQASGYVNTSDYNDIFVNAGTNYANYQGSNYASLASWQLNSGYDAHSDSANPIFVSNTNLDANNIAIYHKGTYISLVTTDINGTTRHNPPTIGADEFSPPSPEAGISAIDSPVTNFCPAIKNVIVTLKNFSSILPIDSVTINWTVNGIAQTAYKWTGTLSAGNTNNTVEVTLGAYGFTGGTAKVKAWATQPNGLTNGVAPANDTSSVALNVYSSPSATVGSNKGICLNSSASIGAAPVNGDTYTWSSNPSGYSSTVSNPSVSPTSTTTYTLTETTTNNCKASNSVVITVNALPAANAGSNSAICSGASANIGATAVSGHSYSWVSSPSGFTGASANPSVSPTATTTYTLTETITATGCTNSNSVTITVNSLPATNPGSNKSICFGGSASIGATAVSGDTYSWASSPSGYTSTVSNPSVSPTITTTYTLTETITATGCTKSNSVIITVNSLPAANAGSNTAICMGASANIGATAVSGDVYSWVSNPVGFTSTKAEASPAPTATTTYTLTETVTATGCTNSNSVIITVNALPNANTGSNKTICNTSSTSIGATAVSGDTYSWSSNPTGFTSVSSNPSVSPTTTTTYTLTETITATGCTQSNSVVITVNSLPLANTGSNKAICNTSGTTIGSTAVSGNAYSWISNPSGYTSTVSNPTVSPTQTTTYTLTETVTGTGCISSNTVVITVNALPFANTGSAQAICLGGSTSIGSTAVSGDTYSWASNPTGFTSVSSNPSVSPTTTTTYTLTETVTATGCTKSNAVVITVNSLPLANTGSNKAICNTYGTSIGSTAISGDTYSWTSSPSGYTSTVSNPSVSPTQTTTYTLTETITATGCTSANAVVVTVNALPLANVGSSHAICLGGSASIGATAVSGDVYSWTSSPSGFTSTLSGPAVSPTTTTTYTLVETVTSTGCTQINSVVITVNSLPAAATGSNKAICYNSGTTIGATAVNGDTYSWVSSPTGFTSAVSNPSVSPTQTTTYTLTETITATGCTKSNAVVITVNSLPPANAGSSATICNTSSTSIGSAAVSGDTYAWSSGPAGFTSTASNPMVSPTQSTTYTLIETITSTGCTNSNTVMVTVNPLPLAVTGSNTAICFGFSTSIGSTAVSGDAYSWVSGPSGYTSALANPTVAPTATTTYTLTETITATGCTQSNSVVITVNSLPAANAGSNKPICLGGNTPIGAVAVSGDTYAWTANPAGYTSKSANPIVSPTVTTTYYLTETVTATGCINSDSIVITVNPLPAANTGTTQTVCAATPISIGAAAVSGDAYSWTSSPSGFTSTMASPTVAPTTTTVYTLVETITATGCDKSNAVIINVNPLPAASTGGAKAVCVGHSAKIGAAPVSGDVYSWVSNPAGFTSSISNPTITPTATGTYYLTETITTTGCSKTDSVLVYLTPPAITGGSRPLCTGSSIELGDSALGDDEYQWTSIPASTFNDTSSHPTVSPTVTTTYILTETVRDGGCFKTDTAIITVYPVPVPNAGSPQTSCAGSGVTIGGTATSGHSYGWASNPSSIVDSTSSPTVNPTITTTYYVTETITATGCTQSDSVVITVNPLPAANAGSSSTICLNGSAQIGAASVSGDTYSWTSNPSGYTSTSSSATLSPAVTTTYYLTETITATGCNAPDSVVITVNPLPAANAGSSSTICLNGSAPIGAAAVSGDTYSWTSNPSGYTSTSSSATLSPAVTTTYYLTETITATGCNASDSVIITVNPLPAANAGSSSTICLNGSASIGAAAVSGDTYSWTSNPSGYTSTSSSAILSPTVTTTYYLTETITATGCNASDSVVITVNPLPAANAGSNSVICLNGSAPIGAAAVSGDTYSWTSNPSGYTSDTSIATLSPTVTTTYYLTETITATGCNASDSVIITVNPLPAANAGSSSTICLNGSASIGAATVSGDTYSWTSNPSGYTSTSSSATLSPAVTTTYYLTETITATGCNAPDSVVITVNPLPAANAGSSSTICLNGSAPIGAAAVSGDTYSWTSNPSGYTSTSSSATLSPAVTTTYYLTETITATGCNASDSVIITVNPLPAANAGSSSTICLNGSASIGAAAVSGDTYSWTSNPSGYTSTSSSATLSPTVTTTYYLTETITATGCNASDSVVITVNPLPAANAGSSSTICLNGSASIGAAAVSGDTYSWTSNPSGYTSTSSSAILSPTVTTTYYLTETITATGCNASDSVVITVNPLPAANAGSNSAICLNGSASIGAAAVSGDTYSWTSNPSGYTSTSSSATLSPTVTTTYYLTETITATGCNASDSVVITVNPLPAANAGSSSTICLNGSASIGAAAVSGDTYSWTSNPSGYTSTSSSATLSPTVTTTYYLTETITATGCNASDSVVITVNPLPAANAGSNSAICLNGSASIGAAAVSGDTYSWTSNPSGYTSTSSSATLSPTVTTTYYLTETITATGCNASDSVVITVNPLPAANAGSSSTICLNGSASIGAAAVSGDTYSWTSNPSGYTSTSSSATLSPTVTTTYYLTETITATGCNASDSVVITVNPLPAANAGSSSTICLNGSASIGAAAVSGDTYSWTSNPSGYTSTSSSATLSPTVTTTYYLTETITATGCNASDSVVITVNPLPAANAGSSSTICLNGSASIGAAAVSGDTYSWTSNPSGYTSTSSSATLSPTVTTTYYLTETITATGCNASDSVVITVNPLPAANAGSSSTICLNGSASIGAAAVSGDTYSWTSNPSGYTSDTSIATLSPTVTTTYYLTETITATGCNASDSVVITVNPLPAANAGSSSTICLNGSASIGAAAVSGDTYSWTSNPSGYTSTSSSAILSPTVTTTYYLTETITATGCNASDSVVITVNPLPAANAGSNSAICLNGSASIGAAAVSGDTYSWTSNPSGYTSTSSSATLSPTVTTTYYLTETITATGCNASDSVVITVNPLPAANAGSSSTICLNGSASIGAAAVSGDTYSWTSNPSGYTSTSSSATLSPTVTTTYYLTETITATGCNASDSVIITVNPLPAANAGNNSAICNGSFTFIGDSVSVSGNTYSWISRPAGFTDSTSNPIITPTVTTTYYLTETITATGCNKSDSVVITVNPLPAANAGNNSAICNGSFTFIGDSVSVSGNTYSWISRPAGFTDSTSNPIITPTVTTTYYLTETITATGCNKSDSVVITVNPLPAASISGATIACANSAVNYKAPLAANVTYQWTAINGSIVSGQGTDSVIVNWGTAKGAISLVEQNASSCSDSAADSVTVIAIPKAPITGSLTACTKDITIYSAAYLAGNTYNWAVSGGTILAGQTNDTVYVKWTSTGLNSIIVRATNLSSCFSADTLAITITATPTQPVILPGNGDTLMASPDSAASYQWYLNGTAITGATGDTFAASSGGNYTVVAYNGSCSSDTSVGYSVTGIGQGDNIITSFKFYPDPANTTVNIDATFAKPATITVALLNTLGQVIMQLDPQRVSAGEYNNSFYVGGLARGMYYLKITTGNGQVVQRIMKD